VASMFNGTSWGPELGAAAGGVGGAVTSIGDFANGNIVGGLTSTITTVGSLLFPPLGGLAGTLFGGIASLFSRKILADEVSETCYILYHLSQTPCFAFRSHNQVCSTYWKNWNSGCIPTAILAGGCWTPVPWMRRWSVSFVHPYLLQRLPRRCPL
jgi:hypothetical protein